MQKAKSKLSPMKNPCDMHLYNSLSNVAIPWAIYMPGINRIDCAGHYQLEMVFVCVYAYFVCSGWHNAQIWQHLAVSVAKLRG